MSDKKCVGTTASGEKRADGAPRHALETLRWVRSVCRKDLSRVWVLCATRCASAVIAVSFALLMAGCSPPASNMARRQTSLRCFFTLFSSTAWPPALLPEDGPLLQRVQPP